MDVGNLGEVNRILAAAELSAVNSLNQKDQREREIISNLLTAISRARIELEYARGKIRAMND